MYLNTVGDLKNQTKGFRWFLKSSKNHPKIHLWQIMLKIKLFLALRIVKNIAVVQFYQLIFASI